MKKARIYIAGKMTGLPNFNYPAFNTVAAQLRLDGLEVLNPAEHFGGRTDLPREIYLRAAVESVLEADAVALLPGWQASSGAILEKMVAEAIGTPVWEIEDE